MTRRLKSFDEAQRHAGAFNRLPPRVVPIVVERVVGSVDRAKIAALGPNFLARRLGEQSSRYLSILRAMETDTPLPAIEVYELGGNFYVLDGHHRVAAARALGCLYLDALVHVFPMRPAEPEIAITPASPVPRRWRLRGWPRRRPESHCACAEARAG